MKGMEVKRIVSIVSCPKLSLISYLLSSPGSAALLVSLFATRQVVQKWGATNMGFKNK
jgi:hypothetical protein